MSYFPLLFLEMHLPDPINQSSEHLATPHNLSLQGHHYHQKPQTEPREEIWALLSLDKWKTAALGHNKLQAITGVYEEWYQ